MFYFITESPQLRLAFYLGFFGRWEKNDDEKERSSLLTYVTRQISVRPVIFRDRVPLCPND